MALCLIGLGSNLGDRAAALERALALLDATPDTRVLTRSTFLETKAVGGPRDQAEFLNAAAIVETSYPPVPLLICMQQIEADLHRERTVRWEPRTIDLDLLLYDQQVIDLPQLVVPHPRMAFRRFVLQPAAQIAPDWIHPPTQFTLGELLDRLGSRPVRIAIVGDPRRSLSRQVAVDPIQCWIADFWVGEWLAAAQAVLSAEELARYEAAWQKLDDSLTRPHLVVWLEGETNQPIRGQLEGLLARPRQFPVLRLRGVDRTAAIAEVAAAASAMLTT